MSRGSPAGCSPVEFQGDVDHENGSFGAVFVCIENWIVNYSQLYNQIGAGFRVGKSSGAVPLALSRSAFDFRSSAVSPKRGFYLPEFMLLNYVRSQVA